MVIDEVSGLTVSASEPACGRTAFCVLCFLPSLSVHEITLGCRVNAKGRVLDEAHALYACNGGLNGWNIHTLSIYMHNHCMWLSHL